MASYQLHVRIYCTRGGPTVSRARLDNERSSINGQESCVENLNGSISMSPELPVLSESTVLAHRALNSWKPALEGQLFV